MPKMRTPLCSQLAPGPTLDPRQQTLLCGLEQLPADQRLLLQLIEREGYSYAQAASILQLPIATVRARLCQVRVQLRDQLVAAGLLVYSRSEGTA